MNNIIKDNWEIIKEKVIKPMYEDGSFPLTVADEITKALQKQIPKKPLQGKEYYWIDSVKYRGRYRDVKKKAYDHRCPSCGEIVSKLANSFCNYCGQAIDWRNEDELATDNNVVTKSGKDNNVVTIGDKIRESNESLTEYIIELLKENEEYHHSLDAQEWNTYLNQPYTES